MADDMPNHATSAGELQIGTLRLGHAATPRWSRSSGTARGAVSAAGVGRDPCVRERSPLGCRHATRSRSGVGTVTR